jgi:autotransporter-like protein
VGAHYFVSPDFLVGALFQADWAKETNTSLNSEASGTGWMAGPYIAGRIPGQEVYFEARAAWGRSDNDINPIGIYTDSFETDRWMARGKISGLYTWNQWTLQPEASLAWFEETQDRYTDTLGNIIPSQTITLGEARFGPNIAYEIATENGGLIQPSLGISGVWTFGTGSTPAILGSALATSDLRARIDAGLEMTLANGWTFQSEAYYDGLGASGYQAYGGSLKLNVPLN